MRRGACSARGRGGDLRQQLLGPAVELRQRREHRAAKAGMIVCQSTRVGSGRTLRSPGLRKKGWVASDNLQPWKARLLLALALNRTSDLDEIQSYFDTY
jgi:L-asparaginase